MRPIRTHRYGPRSSSGDKTSRGTRGCSSRARPCRSPFPRISSPSGTRTSSYSFFSYLHERERLADFVNHQTFFPTRHEFQDYLRWAADRVTADVRYGTEITAVEAVRHHNGTADLFAIHAADGSVVHARSVVVGVGLRAADPAMGHRIGAMLPQPPVPVPPGRDARAGASAIRGGRGGTERSRSGAVPAHPLSAGRGPQHLQPLRVQPGRRQPVREPDLRSFGSRRTPPRVARGAGAGAHAASRHQLLRRRPRNSSRRSTPPSTGSASVGVAGCSCAARRRSSPPRKPPRASRSTSGTTSTAHVETLMCDAVVLATGFEPAPLSPLLGDLAPDGPVVSVRPRLPAADAGGRRRRHLPSGRYREDPRSDLVAAVECGGPSGRNPGFRPRSPGAEDVREPWGLSVNLIGFRTTTPTQQVRRDEHEPI